MGDGGVEGEEAMGVKRRRVDSIKTLNATKSFHYPQIKR